MTVTRCCARTLTQVMLQLPCIFLLVQHANGDKSENNSSKIPKACDNAGNATHEKPDNPYSPLINCSFLPVEFIMCDELRDLHGNISAKDELGYGCVKYGGERFELVEKTSVRCCALIGIPCYGNRTFRKDGVPCIKYTGHYFVTTLIYSVLLGILGMDRFCLGHTGTAIGKLLTLGGAGIWWIVDIVLLITGELTPEDGSNWMPYN